MKPMKKIDTYIYKLGLWGRGGFVVDGLCGRGFVRLSANVEMREITVSYQIDLQHGVDPEFEAERCPFIWVSGIRRKIFTVTLCSSPKTCRRNCFSR